MGRCGGLLVPGWFVLDPARTRLPDEQLALLLLTARSRLYVRPRLVMEALAGSAGRRPDAAGGGRVSVAGLSEVDVRDVHDALAAAVDAARRRGVPAAGQLADVADQWAQAMGIAVPCLSLRDLGA